MQYLETRCSWQERRAVVSNDLRPGVTLLERGPDRFGERPFAIGHDLERELTAPPKKRVVREHDKSRTGEAVGIGAAAIIRLPERGERRRAAVGTVGNLLLAEELEVTVIVQGDDARQSAAAFRGSEDQSLCPGAEPDGP